MTTTENSTEEFKLDDSAIEELMAQHAKNNEAAKDLADKEQEEAKTADFDELSPEEKLITAGLRFASILGEQGKKQLQEHIIVGEDEAVEATLANLLMGGNLHYISKHGGGKTKLLRYGHLVVSGINVVASVPARADLKGGEFSGSSVPLIITETDNDGNVSVRTIQNTAKGIVNAGSQILNMNEIFRISPHAQNTGLEIMESREVDGPNGVDKLDKLEAVIATSNPFSKASRQNQFRAHTANMSRFQQAVLMGNEKYWDAITDSISFDEFTPTPESMLQVISLSALHMARMALVKGMSFEDGARLHMKNLSKSAARELNKIGAEELPPRINVHILEASKALAAVRGKANVTKDIVDTVLERKATAIIVGLKPKDEDEINSVIATIKENAV